MAVAAAVSHDAVLATKTGVLRDESVFVQRLEGHVGIGRMMELRIRIDPPADKPETRAKRLEESERIIRKEIENIGRHRVSEQRRTNLFGDPGRVHQNAEDRRR